MIIRGRVWKYGDSINTDVIFPGKYTYTVSDPAEMAQYAMEDLDPRFAGEVRPGDIVVGGSNFGCGSSREQAVTCLKMAGVGAIIGKSFAPTASTTRSRLSFAPARWTLFRMANKWRSTSRRARFGARPAPLAFPRCPRWRWR